MIRVDRDTFEGLVAQALDSLPEHLQAEISNLEIVVKERASLEERRLGRAGFGGDLFGLYRGVPLTQRNTAYDKVLPDLITIYQQIHEETCDTPEELGEAVARTVRHEVAHHFGLTDGRLEELGAY